MIYGDVYIIGIQLELVAVCDIIKCGQFNFIIDSKLFPGKGNTGEFYITINGLKNSLRYGLAKKMPDIGSLPLEQIDFIERPPGIMRLDTGQVADFGFCCCLGFDGEEDRFFYFQDFGDSFQEKRYPWGTIERLIESLPTLYDIEFCNKEMIRAYGYLRKKPDKRYHSTMPRLKGSLQGELDEFANEWLSCQHANALSGEDKDEPHSDILLSFQWCRSSGWPKRDLPREGVPVAIQRPTAPGERIDFYQEVTIMASHSSEEADWEYLGRQGVVLGVSEEGGTVYGYGVYFRDGKRDEFLTFTPDEVVPTGYGFKREEFYDGSYACASSNTGEFHALHVAGSSNPHNFYVRYVEEPIVDN